jgi:hypothetical protein
MLNKELGALEAQGLLATRLEAVSSRLRELGYPLTDLSSDAADRLLLTITESSTNSSRTLETERIEAVKLEQALIGALGSVEPGIQVFKVALARQKERLVTTESIRAKLSGFSSSFVWSGNRPLAELMVEAESVRNVAVELQAALGRESQAKTSYAESTKRIGSLKWRSWKIESANKASDRGKVCSRWPAKRIPVAKGNGLRSPAESRGYRSDLFTYSFASGVPWTRVKLDNACSEGGW